MKKVGFLNFQHQRGATMIEIMIAVLVFSIGLLGIASTQILGLANTQNSLSRSIARDLSYEIAEVMRIQRDDGSIAGVFVGTTVAADGTITDGNGAPLTTAISACQTLDSDACNATNMAKNEVFLWGTRLATLLPGATAEIEGVGPYTVTISWVEQRSTIDADGDDVVDPTVIVTGFDL